ncbi:unnamed protein product [Calicophoron daubneyi]|uniref:SMB domain-containing protein n=1 Tax=Calicophoron daubneyi TaxID=300641 RepID=A0AAV2TD60_CALDB
MMDILKDKQQIYPNSGLRPTVQRSSCNRIFDSLPRSMYPREKSVSRITQTRNFTHGAIVLLLCTVILLAISSIPLSEASCLTKEGLRVCCQGRRSECTRPIVDGNYRTTSWTGELSSKFCFCDEHCLVTNDCCSDYREICQKPKVDCQVSQWSEWSACSRQCGRGLMERHRTAIRQPQNGGAHCPILDERKSCQGFYCPSRRVGRSDALMVTFMHQARAEVAHLLPLRGDVLRMTRRYDMRWDERRKLYLGRLIKMNLTEPPDPDPYCVIYEITHANPACQSHNPLWQFTKEDNGLSRTRRSYSDGGLNSQRQTFTFDRGTSRWSNGYRYGPRFTSFQRPSSGSLSIMSSWGMSELWTHAWQTHAGLLIPGQQICVTCYPAYMREDLGYRCSGTGLLNMETRWRALRTADCQGTFRMVSLPQRKCTCERGSSSFIFV